MKKTVGILAFGALLAACGGGSGGGSGADVSTPTVKTVESMSFDWSTRAVKTVLQDGSSLIHLTTRLPTSDLGQRGRFNPARGMVSGVAGDEVGRTYVLEPASGSERLARLTVTATGETFTVDATPGERTEVRAFRADGSFVQGAVLFFRDARAWVGRLPAQAFTGYEALAGVTEVTSRAAELAPWLPAELRDDLRGQVSGGSASLGLVSSAALIGHLVSPAMDATVFAPVARVGRIATAVLREDVERTAQVRAADEDGTARTLMALRSGAAPLRSDGTYAGTLDGGDPAAATRPERIALRLSESEGRLSGSVSTTRSAPGPLSCRKPSYTASVVDGKRFGNLITIRLYMDTADGYLSDVVAAIVSADGRTLRGLHFDPSTGPSDACPIAFDASFVQDPPAKE